MASAISRAILGMKESGSFIRSGLQSRNTYGSEEARWKSRAIDSRTCSLPNQIQIAEWLEDYGEDSDFFRVRVRGLPPLASELPFIDQGRLNLARPRTVP